MKMERGLFLLAVCSLATIGYPSVVESLIKQRDQVIQQRDEVIRQNQTLLQRQKELIRQRDEAIRQRDEALRKLPQGGVPAKQEWDCDMKVGTVRVLAIGIDPSYSLAIGKIADTAASHLRERGFNMPSRITVRIECNRAKQLRLWTDGSSTIYFTLPGPEKLLRPAKSGAFNIYGLCHECSHVAMYRTLPHASWMTTAFAEGWAHYHGSVITDDLFKRHGSSIWPDSYDYSTDGTKRLHKEILKMKEADQSSVTAGAKFFLEIDSSFSGRLPALLSEMSKARPTPLEFEAAISRACSSPKAGDIFRKYAGLLIK